MSILSLNQFIVDRKADYYTANGFRLLVPHLRCLSKKIEASFTENDLSEALKNRVLSLKDYPSYFSCFGQICSVHFDMRSAKSFASSALNVISHDSMPDDAYAETIAHSLLGLALSKVGRLFVRKRHIEYSIALQLKLERPEHTSLATSYNNLASVLHLQYDLKEAKEYYERALDIREQTLGFQRRDVAQS